MSCVNNKNATNSSSCRNDLNEHPLITVYGNLSEFILGTGLSNQITNDLARESIDWQRLHGDLVAVYLDAKFVALDEEKHFLTDFIEKSDKLKNGDKSSRNMVYHRDDPLSQNSNFTSTVKRNHSFNVIQRQFSRNSYNQDHSTGHPNFGVGKGDVTGSSPDDQVNTQLFKLLAQRYLLTNGSNVLVNSFWLDAYNDLESYNNSVRDSLLDWFSKILTSTAYYNRIGLCNDFLLDFCIVIVIRNVSTVSNQSTKASADLPKNTSSEQVLSLEGLIAANNSRNAVSNVFKKNALTSSSSSPSGNKFSKSSFISATAQNYTSNVNHHSSSTLNSTLSSSLSSLTSSNLSASTNSGTNHHSSTPLLFQLSHAQLVDQIRNDLLVCFQLFQQKNFGNFDSNIPAKSAHIAKQLVERIVVFDSTSNGNQTTSLSNIVPDKSSSIVSSNPIISSTAKTFSALSNFSSGSIKISTSSMMSPSKSSFSSKAFKSSSSSSNKELQPQIYNYSSFVIRLRMMLLDSYTRQLDAYVALIDQQRKLRHKTDWDFFGFFLLQEELALGYKNLGLYNDALIQYDKLEALFSESIRNFTRSGIGRLWLQKHLIYGSKEDLNSNNDSLEDSIRYTTWNGLCLCNEEAVINLRSKIVECICCDSGDLDSFGLVEDNMVTSGSICPSSPGSMSSPGVRDDTFDFNGSLGLRPYRASAMYHHNMSQIDGHISLIDFRNYLFARQCYLLCMLNKPWVLASRALPFLQTCVGEINQLEISIAPGGLACWVCLSGLEILHQCERYSDSSQLESYSYHTVGLWSYVREKLAELGRLCNLMPGSIDDKLDSSEHLHRMVELVAGMGADPHVRASNNSDKESSLSPQERLKEALSSSDLFLKHYLEITELSMGTYKHIGYIRSARLIGKELSELYLKLNKPQQALPFLLDLYNMFQAELWCSLKHEASQMLAQCLQKLYFNSYSNHLDLCSFNVEATVRSAFRIYLLMFVVDSTKQSIQSTIINCNSAAIIEHTQSAYLQPMIELLRHYNLHGIQLADILTKINTHSNTSLDKEHQHSFVEQLCLNPLSPDRPLLVIHNIYSDLFHESSMSSCSSSSLNSNPNSSSTSSKTKLTSSDNNLPNSLQCCAYNNNFWNNSFIRVEDVQFYGQTVDYGKVSGLNRDTRSNLFTFVAGTDVCLKLCVYSYLSFSLDISHLMVTLQRTSETSLSQHPKQSVENLSHIDLNDSKINQNSHFHSTYHHHHHGRAPPVIMETYYSVHQNEAGLRCKNSAQLLKRSDMNGTQKFMSQFPVSLLNQRLSNDENNFKHYRFLLNPYKFLLSNSATLGDDKMELKPGLNVFQLKFPTTEQFFSQITQYDQSVDSNSNSNNNHNTNQVSRLNFCFDQLVMMTSLPPWTQSPNIGGAPNQSDLRFSIVDEFHHYESCLPISFNLVKCLPKIDLLPTDGAKKSSFLIGVDHKVCLSLHSCVNTLPKGLKCFIKIIPISNTSDNDEQMSNSIDYRAVNVSLHRRYPDHAKSSDDSLLYFFLDRELKPFEEYQLNLELKSTYNKPQIVEVYNNNSFTPDPAKDLQRHFLLTVSWSHLETESYNTVNASCHFTLREPFMICPKIKTCLKKKFVEVTLRCTKQIPPGLVFHFNVPSLSNGNTYHSATSAIENSSQEFELKKLSLDETDEQVLKLLPLNHISFVWEVLSNSVHSSLKRMMLELSYRCGVDDDCPPEHSSIVHVAFDLRTKVNFETQYLIRQTLELAPIKNSEHFRVGTPCLLRVNIERCFPKSYTEDLPEDYVVYELVSACGLWTLVPANSRAGIGERYSDSDHSAPSSIDVGSLERNDITGFKCQTNEYCSLPANPSSGTVATNNQGGERITLAMSRVLKFSQNESVSETVIELIPMCSGYIPVPTVCLSRYVQCGEPLAMETLASTVPSSITTNTTQVTNHEQDQPGQQTSQTQKKAFSSKAIDSLSAKFSENLSLMMTHLSNKSSGSSIAANSATEHSAVPTSNKPQAQLVPFKFDQVYNLSCAMVNVLPSITGNVATISFE